MSAQHRIVRIVAICVALTLSACDNGLEPPPAVKPGISGTVFVVPGTWPRADSLAQITLWIAASQVYPLDSVKIFQGILASPPTVYLYPSFSVSLPLGVDTVGYAFTLPAATYKYICVLQHYGSDLTITSFKVVGLYHQIADSTQPRTIVLIPGQNVPGVDITVDFYHPPPQPF